MEEYTAVIKGSTVVITLITENIPNQLTERPQWVCWRLETRDGKPTKVPYTPGTERRASSTELMTWATFEEALAAYEAGEPPYDGIGFVFCNADPFVGIDLDDCRDEQSGEFAPWAQKILDRCRRVTSKPRRRGRACTSSLRAQFATEGQGRRSALMGKSWGKWRCTVVVSSSRSLGVPCE
jgi:putative DNA primase/helicase